MKNIETLFELFRIIGTKLKKQQTMVTIPVNSPFLRYTILLTRGPNKADSARLASPTSKPLDFAENIEVVHHMEETPQKAEIYHERQRLQFCLLHSLNNLFQDKNAFTRGELNAIAERLDLDDPNKGGWSPLSVVLKSHHNVLTGNYDINVLIAALEDKGKSVVWHDRRNGASSIDLDGPEDKLMGIVLNVPVRRYGGLWRGRHWVALRRIEDVWYNLDSDLVAPYAFRDTEETREFLDGAISGGAELLLVMNNKR